jgi:hypothetical protein
MTKTFSHSLIPMDIIRPLQILVAWDSNSFSSNALRKPIAQNIDRNQGWEKRAGSGVGMGTGMEESMWRPWLGPAWNWWGCWEVEL